MRALLLATLVCIGCAHPPRAPPLTGWRALHTPHLRLRTDLPPADARTTVEQLETLRAALQTAWSEAEETPGLIEAIVLRDGAELRTFTELTGVATLTARGPLLVTAGSPTSFGDLSPDSAVLAHEMAHDLGHRWMPGAPRWFDEGLASYLESAELIDTGRVRLGAIRRADLEYARAHPLIPLDILALTPWETQGPSAVRALYRSARLWVQVLRTEEGQRMRALEAALHRGVSWRIAWSEARQGLDLARLGEALQRWLRAGDFPTELHRFVVPPISIEEQPLALWEVHVTRAELWSVDTVSADAGNRTRRVREELEAAVVAAPDEPLPRVLLADLETDPDRRRTDAEELRRRYPRSPDAAVFLARVLREQGGPVEGRRGAMLDAVILAPDNVDALTGHALEEARAGELARAFDSLHRAEKLAPWNPTVHVARANILSSLGECDEAGDEVQRALDVLADTPPPGDVEVLVRERARLQASCVPALRR
jgi:tetratricopeptide (TPR) repeat protein